MHHRIVFVRKLPEITHERFHLDWQMVHGSLLMPAPNLRGYVQNRPVAAQWGRGPADGVAELYYDSPELEQVAFDTHQSKLIRQHEHSFMAGEETFSALVEEETLVDGRQTASRVRAPGADVADIPEGAAVRIGVLHLDQPEPWTGSRHIVSAWTTSEPGAFAVKDALGGEAEGTAALVVTPTPIVAPPLAPYAG
ncbi:EthD family reductase [Corynebacterium sp. 335C]